MFHMTILWPDYQFCTSFFLQKILQGPPNGPKKSARNQNLFKTLDDSCRFWLFLADSGRLWMTFDDSVYFFLIKWCGQLVEGLLSRGPTPYSLCCTQCVKIIFSLKSFQAGNRVKNHKKKTPPKLYGQVRRLLQCESEIVILHFLSRFLHCQRLGMRTIVFSWFQAVFSSSVYS